MQKTHIYILQLIGILILVCGYLLGDQPDSLSVMYFNPSASEVISSANHHNVNTIISENNINTQDWSSKKMLSVKHISNEVILPEIINNYQFVFQMCVIYSPTFKQNYNYLFITEINPPPPKNEKADVIS